MRQCFTSSFVSGKTRARLARAVAISAALACGNAAAAQDCMQVTGTVGPLTPVACSGFGVGCFTGELSGDVQGSFQSRLLVLLPTSDTTVGFVARSTIDVQSPRNGTIYTADAGTGTGCVFVPMPDGTTQPVCTSSTEVLTVVGGTKAYKNAYGTIILTGDYMTGGSGNYSGQICLKR